MGTFPRTDAEILMLANEMVSGLIINPLVYPTPPLTPAQLAALKGAFETAIQNSLTTHAAAEAATQDKNTAEEALTQGMKKIAGYAETTVGNDDAKLNLIGLTGRAAPTPLAAPGQARHFEATVQGPGNISFDWKAAAKDDGGVATSYCVERRLLPNGDWEVCGSTADRECHLNNQVRGVQLEYRVCGQNKAGLGAPSNIVAVVL